MSARANNAAQAQGAGGGALAYDVAREAGEVYVTVHRVVEDLRRSRVGHAVRAVQARSSPPRAERPTHLAVPSLPARGAYGEVVGRGGRSPLGEAVQEEA